MKQYISLPVVLLFLISLMLLLVSCSDPATRSLLKGSSSNYETEGWVDDDTFQVRTLGAPNPKSKGFVRRRTQAEEAALLNAQKRIIELIVGAEVSGRSGSDSGELEEVKLSKKLSAVIRGGTVVNKSFDEDDNCSITFRIRASGLKAKVEALVTQPN